VISGDSTCEEGRGQAGSVTGDQRYTLAIERVERRSLNRELIVTEVEVVWLMS